MKFLYVILLISALGYQSNAAPPLSIRQIIDEFFRELKQLIPDTINLPDQHIETPENDLFSAFLDTTNTTLKGVKNFDVAFQYRGTLIPIPTGFTFNVTDVDVDFDFLQEFDLLNIPQIVRKHIGHVDTTFFNFNAEGTVSFTLLPRNLTVTSVEVSLGGAKVDIEGVINQFFSELLSEQLSKLVAPAFNRFSDLLSPIFVDIFNAFLNARFNSPTVSSENVSWEENQQEHLLQLKGDLDNFLLQVKEFFA